MNPELSGRGHLAIRNFDTFLYWSAQCDTVSDILLRIKRLGIRTWLHHQIADPLWQLIGVHTLGST
jgi:hypothetical protein